MNDIELRFMDATEIRLQAREGGGLPMITGYAAVFNSLSEEFVGGFREMILPGAFTQSLADGDDVLARSEHQTLLGRSKSGTLRLFEDKRGLRYEIDTPNTQAGRDTVELIQRGDMPGSSFAFRLRQPGGDSWRIEKGKRVRELRSVKLVDIAPVVTPAYPATDVALRSLMEFEQETLPRTLGRLAMRLSLAERV